MIRSRKRLNGISEFDDSRLRHHRHGFSIIGDRVSFVVLMDLVQFTKQKYDEPAMLGMLLANKRILKRQS
ncbi:hypothetical protein Leryth_002477 [Lithospermum erythrorhizon]|nr:hypothetical protein Leryth_002477 [Lithospermum erythrorhizon]